MSERRSWDTDGFCYATDADTAVGNKHAHSKARNVLWRDEWPPQSEVPHAGETVWSDMGREYTVATGIPVKSLAPWPWSLAVYDANGLRTHFDVTRLSRTPPTKRYRVTVQGGRYNFLVRATDEADAIAKAVTVEEVDAD